MVASSKKWNGLGYEQGLAKLGVVVDCRYLCKRKMCGRRFEVHAGGKKFSFRKIDFTLTK